jgi:tripartite-type tricarboxylate transporter receptor subunit TctC
VSGRRRLLAGAGAVLAAGARAAVAQQQQAGTPTRPVALLVPFSAGSTNDILARMLAPEIGARLGQPVPVDNRAGAGGTLGIAQVARGGRAEGRHLLGIVSTSTIPINRALFRDLPYDPQRDLVVLAVAASTPNALIVGGAGPFRSMEEFVAAGRDANRPPLRFFSPGNGTSQHLSCVQFARAAGLRTEHIPYRGPAEGITGLLAGETDWGFSAVPSIAGMARDGRMRVLGTTGTRPAAALPGAPTFAAQGFAGFEETDVWYGVAVARDTPPDAVATLRDALAAALAAPDLRERLAAAGFYPVEAMTPAETEAFVGRQVGFWADLVRLSGARID